VSRRRRGKGHGGGGHEEGSERWLLTYADMITLLTAFFIMMYSMSVLNITKFRQVAISIRSGYGGQLDNSGHSIMNPAPGGGIRPNIIPELDGPEIRMEKRVKKFIAEEKLQKELRIRQTEQGLVVSISTDPMLFPKGQSALTPRAEQVLKQLTDLIRSEQHPIRVEGHSDDLPIHTARFPSNWELSTTRATTVVRYMIDRLGVEPGRLSAAGYADSHPLYPNDSEQHRAYNRRVDLVILRLTPGSGGKSP
jgi:chemotaxis protein MotB